MVRRYADTDPKIPNWKSDSFYRLGFQQLAAVAVIAGAIIGRAPASQIPFVLDRVGSGRNQVNTQLATMQENSRPLLPQTSPTMHAKVLYGDSGHSYLLNESWRYYYECNR